MSIIRQVKSLIYRKSVFYFLSTTFLIWTCGLFDHLLETSFEEFRWPPYEVDVLVETRRALRGKSERFASENDVQTFRQISVPQCRSQSKALKLLIMVKSSAVNGKQRDAIRRTWGGRRRYDSVQTVFVVGKAVDDTLKTAVLKEINRYSDVLYVDLADTYRNNTRKFIHSIIFAFEPGNGCQSPEFLLLVDDDYMVNVAALLNHISEENHSLHLYEGWMFDTTPFRFRLHKHAVSLKVYPFDRYPPYISAGAVLMSRNTVAHFYYALQLVKIYPFDDIYAGILAYLLQIRPRHNDAFVFWTRSIRIDEWKRGDILAAHGYSADQLIEEFPHIVGS